MTKTHPPISDEIFIGRMISGPKKAFCVSLIVSRNKRYCSVQKEYQSAGDNTWLKSKGYWCLYEKLEDLLVLLHRAQTEARKRNWGGCVPSQLDMGEEKARHPKQSFDNLHGEIIEEFNDLRKELDFMGQQMSDQANKLEQIERLLTLLP